MRWGRALLLCVLIPSLACAGSKSIGGGVIKAIVAAVKSRPAALVQTIQTDDRNIVRTIKGIPNGREHNGLVTFAGGVELLYRGYHIYGDSVTYARSSHIFIADGNASLIGNDAIIRARRIISNFRDKTYEAYDGKSDLAPSRVGGVLLSDLYSRGQYAVGSDRESFFTNSGLTTCSYNDPHFEIRAKDTDIRYHRRIIFRDLDIVLLRHRIFHLPFLSIPLEDRTYQNLPLVGQNSYEGYFIKTRYGIPIAGDNGLSARIDYMTKIGPGLGADFSYRNETGKHRIEGLLSSYLVAGAGSLNIQQNHVSEFGWGSIRLENSYQNHDYLVAPDSVIENSRATLTIRQHAASSAITWLRSSNEGGGYGSIQQSFGLSDSRSIGPAIRTSTQVNFTYGRSSFQGADPTTNIARKQVDISFRAERDLKKATAELAYQRTVPVGTISNFYTGNEVTPNLTLRSDARRLLGNSFSKALPFTTALSIGEFGNSASGNHITRDFFNFAFNRSGNYAARSRLDLTGQFSQGLYSDNTAQYVLGLGSNYSYRLGRDTSFNLRYNYLRPEGFSPLGIDQTGKSHLITEDISFRPSRSLLLGAQSGYDFLQASQGTTSWQVLGLRSEYTPSKTVLLRSLGSYDPFLKGFANLRFDLSIRAGSTFIGLGAQYDSPRHTFGQINLFASAIRWGRAKLDLRLNYNGYSNQFDSRQLAITYDLHCAEAVFQIIDNPNGFSGGTQIQFFVRLKALPFDGGFGSGVRGQGIGTGTGAGY